MDQSTPPKSDANQLLQELIQTTGVNPSSCYQCGKCSAGCPMVEEMVDKPHDFIRHLSSGNWDRVFQSQSLWLCLTCETCTTRCPNKCDPSRVIDFCREESTKIDPANAPLRIRSFHKAFLNQIRTYGRVAEFPLVASYKFRSGALFDDIFLAPGLFLRGKLTFIPHKVDGIMEIRRIFAACLADSTEDHAAQMATQESEQPQVEDP